MHNLIHLLLKVFLPLSDISLSLIPSSGLGTSFTFHPHLRSTQLIGDQKTVVSLSAINPTDLPYRTIEENARPPTLDLYDYPLRLDIQILNHYRKIRDIISFLQTENKKCNIPLFILHENRLD